MSNEQSYRAPRRRGPRGPMGGGMMPGEKAKDFKGSFRKLLSYIGKYKIGIVAVMILAICSTVFSVLGPKVMGKATTALADGLMNKVAGTGGIDFTLIGKILLFTLGLYIISAVFSFFQGFIMTGITQKICYRMRKEISEKINRMPMKYFESRTYGEVLSRITNDVDTLGQSLNQSVTQIITSVATIIGVLVMMLSISPLMTLIALVILPISALMVSAIAKFSQKYFRTQQEYLGHINGQVEETYSGHLVIQAFNKEKETIKRFNNTNHVLYESAWKSQFLSGMMQPVMVFKKGCCVYEKGALEKGQADMQAEIQEQRSLSVGDFPEHFYHSVQCREAEKEDFQIKAEDPSAAFAEVNVIKISDFGTATTPVKKRLSIKNGNICWKEAGLSLAVVYERYGKNGNVAKALVEGTFKEPGAAATTWSHDSHNLLVMGNNEEDMELAQKRVRELQGGYVVYAGGKLAAQAPLPIGGILSDQPVSVLGKQLGQVRKAMEDLGYDNNNVIMSMSTLCLPVSPRLKLTDFGLLEVKSQEKVPLIQTYFDKNGMRI